MKLRTNYLTFMSLFVTAFALLLSNKAGAAGDKTGAAGKPADNTELMKPACTMPEPRINIYGDLTACNGNVTLTGPGWADHYIWSTGDTTSAITVTGGGSFTLRVVSDGGCTSGVASTTIVTGSNLSAPVIANYSNTNNLSFPKGSAFIGVVNHDPISKTSEFYSGGATGGTDSTYLLYKDGVFVKELEGTWLQYVSESGSYTFRFRKNGCLSPPSNAFNVTFSNEAPQIVAATTVICQGGRANITYNGSLPGAIEEWERDGQGVPMYAYYHNVWEAGTYKMQLTVGEGATADYVSAYSNSVTISFSGAMPNMPYIDYAAGTNLCSGDPITLTASTTNGRYVWSTGDTSQSITVSAAGTYTVRSYLGTCTTDASDPVVLSVGSLPAAPASISGLSTFAGSSSQNYSVPVSAGILNYHWSYSGTGASFGFTNGITSTVTVTFNSAATSGTLSAKAENACGIGAAVSYNLTYSPAGSDLSISSDRTLGSGTYNNITISGTPKITLSGNINLNGSLNLPAGATLETGCHTISGSGTFNMAAGSKLSLCNTDGIATTGNTGAVQTAVRNFSSNADYEYTGTANQATGNGLPAQVRNLTINNTAGVTLSEATSVSNVLTLAAGNFNLAGKAITLLSSASGTARLAELGNGATFSNAGQFRAQRWLDPYNAENAAGTLTYGAWVMVGANTKNQTISAFSVNNAYTAQTYDQTTNRGGSVNLYNPSDVSAGSYNGWSKPSGADMPFEPGSGARVWFTKSTFYGTGATYTLTGEPATGNIVKPLEYCASGCANSGSADGSNGWNLVANPYPSAIDWNSNGIGKTNVNEAVYIWSNRKKSYSSYLGGLGVNGGTNLLASGQAFMLSATGPNAQLTFSESAKISSNPSVQRNNAGSLVRLNVQAGEFSDEIIIADRANAQRGFDAGMDAKKLWNTRLNIWAEPASGAQAIASLPLQDRDSVNFSVSNSEAGLVSLGASEFSDLSNRFDIAVRDNSAGSITPLTEETNAISIALQAGVSRHFTLLLQPKSATGIAAATGKASMSISPAPNKGRFNISLSNGAIAESVLLFDIAGRLMPVSLNGNNVDAGQLSPGIYTLKVKTGTTVAVEKIVVE